LVAFGFSCGFGECVFFSCCVSLLDPLSWLEMFLVVLLIFLILFPSPFCFFFVAGATTRTQNINKKPRTFFSTVFFSIFPRNEES